MNVLLISQCSGNALAETRRILDQFAERRGDRTWQTPITQQGLDTLRQLLKKTARKNTAVACHWIHGNDRTELIWLVGDVRRFNSHGAVPTNFTTRDILRSKDETDWHSAEDIKLLARMAALWHDFGKANMAFQVKLKKGSARPDAFRHEWVSLRLFMAYVGSMSDNDWLTCLAAEDHDDKSSLNSDWLHRLIKDDIQDIQGVNPFGSSMPPLAKIVGWLILTHHRLPQPVDVTCFNTKQLYRLPQIISKSWAGSRDDASDEDKRHCWEFPHGLPDSSNSWRAQARQCSMRMLARSNLLKNDWLSDPFIAHVARMVLMLADHHYSSLQANPTLGDYGYKLYANTDQDGSLKQRLDEHLIGVAKTSRKVLGSLLHLSNTLPRIVRHKGFHRRSADPRFRWQDKAYDLTQSIHERTLVQGFFGINMASTGSGKTLANGRIMAALSDQERGTRFTIALGLRTLTLQTGEAYCQHLGLGADDLAILVGDTASCELFAKNNDESRQARQGSESAEALLSDNSHVYYESNLPEGPLREWLGQGPAAKLVYAPILTCTIDHLMPATESTRGGHQIPPMLRLMTSDLVLDEPDDFGLEDLPALSRLVFWAGLLGSRVLLSSATLPPALVRGLYDAYSTGRRSYAKNHSSSSVTTVSCAWFDEWNCDSGDHDTGESFLLAHESFVDKRLKKLDKEENRRHALIKSINVTPCKGENFSAELADNIMPMMQELHATNHETTGDGRRVSIGLLRMANIDPIIDLAQAICRIGAPENWLIHLCVYHSRYPQLQRSGIEARLDRILSRGKQGAILQQPEITQALTQYSEKDQVWLVLASPVAEVGRDHDYDWAIVEPSSMRSIIQLAGRVRRHRFMPYEDINIYLLETNVKSIKQGNRGVSFNRPGFESKDFPLDTHNINDLLTLEQWKVINSAPRIRARTKLLPNRNLADIEHVRLQSQMIDGLPGQALSAQLFWTSSAHLCGVLQRKQMFRAGQIQRQYTLALDYNEKLCFLRREEDAHWTDQSSTLQMMEPLLGSRIIPWGEPDYLGALLDLAESLGMEPEVAARRYGAVLLPEEVLGWQYHPYFGFRRQTMH